MPHGSGSLQALKAVSELKSYVSDHLFSCENEVLTELSGLYLKNAEHIDKTCEGLAEFVAGSLINYCNE